MINGVRIFPFLSFDSLFFEISERKGILVAINAEKILHATDETRAIINRNIGYCDGAGAVLALKKHGCEAIKLPGCELWLKIVERCYKDRTFYLVGGRQEIIEETVDRLRTDFPGIRIVGFRNGYIETVEERQNLVDDVVRTRPDVVFVAMGSPKQELLMEEMSARHEAIYQGLGGSFDVYTGHVRRAPEWWVRHNMEYLYRLIREPKRIKRQIHLLRFLWLLKRGKI